MTATGGDDGSRRLHEIRAAAEGAPEVEPGAADSDGRVVPFGGPRSPRPDGSETALVLNPNAPLAAARRLVERDYTLGGVCTLRHWRETWIRWDGSSYEILKDRPVRDWIYLALERVWRVQKGDVVPFDPSSRQVSDVFDALKAVVALDDRIEPPAWLGPAPIDDRPPASEFVAVRNGLVHLPSRELWPPDPSFFAFGVMPIDFDPEAAPPVEWLGFLNSIWPNDQASIDTLQEWFGYLIAAETAQQKILFLHGRKRSGKGTIGRVLRNVLLGQGKVAAVGMGDFGNRFGLEPLIGKSVAIVPDARLSNRSDQAIIVERTLSISGEDAITIDRKYAAPWCGCLGTRLVLFSNEIPKLRDTACALPSRFIFLKLTESFEGREDLALGGRLSGEGAGIFNWALEGWHRLRARGRFIQPESAMDLVRTMIGMASSVAAFLDERCLRSSELEIEKDRLLQAFNVWRKGLGEGEMSMKLFTERLQTQGIFVKQSRKLGRILGDRDRPWVYKGVDLREP